MCTIKDFRDPGYREDMGQMTQDEGTLGVPSAT